MNADNVKREYEIAKEKYYTPFRFFRWLFLPWYDRKLRKRYERARYDAGTLVILATFDRLYEEEDERNA